MIAVRGVEDASRWAGGVRSAGLSLGLVPTMGALHRGHHSLIDGARAECDRVAVSIFVNPAQFGPAEDFAAYPRTPEADAAGCRERGVDLLLLGEPAGPGGIYPPGFQTWVEVEPLARPLCGRFRPGHFRGVATVVALLFGIFKPHRAYFGRKDYQQARLIERMARDLYSGIDIRILPTVRDADGLALSSRNRRLGPADRLAAAAIPRALQEAERAFLAGEDRASRLEALARQSLAAQEGLELQYASVVDAETLEAVPGDRIAAAAHGAVLAVAAVIGGVRLIDNVLLASPGRRA